MAKTLPVLLLKDFVLLPHQEVKVEPGQTFSYETLNLSEREYEGELIIVSPKDALEEMPDLDDLPNIAVTAKIKKKITLPNGNIRITFVGIKRVKINKYFESLQVPNVLECHYLFLQEPSLNNSNEIAFKKELTKLVKRFVRLSPNVSNDILQTLNEKESLNDFIDFIAAFLPTTIENKTYYLEETSLSNRATRLMEDLTVELKILKLDQKINQSLQEAMDKNQRDFVLREKMREIERELGEENKKQTEILEYKKKLNSLELPNEIRHKILNELNKYEFMSENSPDISFVRNYLELFFDLPWNEETIECEDLKIIENTLNKTHYGLKEIKTRIIEYAAMKKRNPMLQSPIICLVGPPGVGKSTIASSIAQALHRKFHKISVGGLNDSSELTGHRRTYLGSAPGRIITALEKCGSKNPLILIDEVDKMVKDYKGDPASVLLDILDPNLNQNFVDSYLEEAFDLSHVLFLLTANNIENIPSELKDRLEIIELSSYSTLEKIKVAKEYLLPAIHLDYHVREKEIELTDKALKHLILNYTNEAGVRELKRKLEELHRKIILNGMKKEKNLDSVIDAKDIKKYLEEVLDGKELRPTVLKSGLVNGLAVTVNGGVLLPLESVAYPGTGKITITGLVGNVMQESIEVVMSFIHSHLKELEMSERIFKNKDIHIHFMEGSIPKDGPSAGITITTSIISLLTNRLVSEDIAMTGEMTLRGEIIPVGGIKEKVIGAYNRGIKKIIIPELNKIDLKSIPKEVKNELEIIFVKEYKEVYQIVFKENNKK